MSECPGLFVGALRWSSPWRQQWQVVLTTRIRHRSLNPRNSSACHPSSIQSSSEPSYSTTAAPEVPQPEMDRRLYRTPAAPPPDTSSSQQRPRSSATDTRSTAAAPQQHPPAALPHMGSARREHDARAPSPRVFPLSRPPAF